MKVWTIILGREKDWDVYETIAVLPTEPTVKELIESMKAFVGYKGRTIYNEKIKVNQVRACIQDTNGHTERFELQNDNIASF